MRASTFADEADERLILCSATTMLTRSRRRLFMWGQSLEPIIRRVPRGHFIGNAFDQDTSIDVNSAERTLLASSPSDEVVLMTVAKVSDPRGTVDRAVEAAAAQFRTWSAVTAAERADFLMRISSELDKRADEVAKVEALNSGMCLSDAVASVQSCVDIFRRYSAVAMLPVGTILPPFGTQGTISAYTHKEAVGVVGLITPFNFPLEMGTWKIAPALAAGNCVVWKPPEDAPLSAQLFADIVRNAMLPAGVVNVVQGGREFGEAIVQHPKVDLIGFTGSIAAGVAIQVEAAKSGLKRCNLELGGNAPLIVCEDFDVDTAATIAMQCFSNSGQSCTSARRVFVPSARKLVFLKAIVDRIKQRKLGHSLDPVTQQGPLISGLAMERVLDAVQKAELRGVSVVTGGYRPSLPAGYFVAPTVVTDISPTDPLIAHELFGPVMLVRTYDTLDEAVQECNGLKYGLSANILSNDVHRCQHLTRRISAGTVWINGADMMNATTPFGGFRSSGYGKDLGIEGIDSYSRVKTVITHSLRTTA
jgi:acyl-CoA reductase-like NAD-dependent aldehyde dehydrogenase